MIYFRMSAIDFVPSLLLRNRGHRDVYDDYFGHPLLAKAILILNLAVFSKHCISFFLKLTGEADVKRKSLIRNERLNRNRFFFFDILHAHRPIPYFLTKTKEKKSPKIQKKPEKKLRLN